MRLPQGDLPAAIAALERARDLARAWHIAGLLPWIMPELGAAYARSGRVVEALAVLEEVLAQAASQGMVARGVAPPGLPGRGAARGRAAG